MRLQLSAYEEQIKRIGEQNEEQLKRIAEQSEEQIKIIGEQIRGLKTELSEMRNSRSWRFLNRIQQIRYKIAPQNSRRDKIIIRLLHILK